VLHQLFRVRRDHRSPRRSSRHQRPAVGLLTRAAGFESLEGRALLSTTTITQWNFEAQTLEPSFGSGTAALLSQTSGSFNTGTGGSGTFAWQTSTFANQGEESGARGVEFRFSTVGYESLRFSFDHRASGTASRWAQVDYTLDGTTWNVGHWNNNGGISPHDAFYSFDVDLSGITGANDNPAFGVRIVSIFSPQAFDQNSLLAPYTANTAYMRANAGAVYAPNTSTATGDYGAGGNWRLDNVTLAGTLIVPPDPSSELAVVTTAPTVTGVTSFTAMLAGSATAEGVILERGFVVAPTGVNPAPQLDGTGVTRVVATVGSGAYSAVATRLAALTGYSFRAFATTGAGTTYGDVATFATAEGPIAFWDFAGNTTATTGGVGTASHVGGTTEAAEADAWRVTTFPAQSADSGTAGVQFLVPTVGYEDVVLSFNHRASNTASRWARLDYTLDGGGSWTSYWNNAGALSGEADLRFTVDFTSVVGARNNPDFGVRIVSIFSPIEFNPGVPNETYAGDTAYHRGRLTGGSAYATTGNWQFRNVTFTGTAQAAQAPILTVAQPTVVKGTSATLGGAVLSGGGREVTARGVLVAAADFGGTLELGGAGVSRFDAAAGGLSSFTTAATNLDLATSYVYRAFATNADGLTGYSETLEFMTLSVDLISTTTTLDAFPAQETFGNPVTFTGTVSAVDSAQTPSGTVEIRVGGPTGTLLASASVAGDGTYSAASSSIGIGTYSGIAAHFLVGGTFDGSSSAVGGSLTIDPRAFTPGNLLVLRVGDGTTTLGVNADSVALVEFTPDGTLVQEIPVAAAGSTALTLGTNPNNGILSLAADRQSVTFGGYRTAAGSANPVPANVPRVVGSVGADGVVDTSRGFAGVFTSEDFRSVATDDGSNYWLSGAGINDTGGVRHVTADGTSLTGLLASPPANPNMRQVLVVDGNLFTASGSNPTGRSIYPVGTGLPTTGGQPLVELPPIGGSSQWQSFFFADLDPAVSWGNTGFDTIYATADFAAITKLSYVASDAGFNWVDRGSVVLAGASGITGFVGGDGAVTLYVSSTTAATGGISTIVDSSGAGGALSGTAANINAATPIAAGANYAFRGLAFVPRAGIDTTATITGITSAPTAEFLQEVTFSAEVVAASGGDAPTGVVQFRSGNVLLATATLTGSSTTASATVATTAIPFGTYSGITARFIPDGNASANLFNPSVSTAFGEDLVVEPQGQVTTTVLAGLSPLAASYGDLITFSGTVTGDGAGAPSGTIQIRAGGPSGTLLAAGDVVAGAFSVSTDTIVGGSYAGIVAVFSGVPGFQNSVSTAFEGTLEVAFTQLGLGDIAFMGYQPADPDAVSFVLLRDVIAGTTLTITDKPWSGTALGADEGTSTITFTQAFSAGTVFEYLEFDLASGDIDGERWAHVVGGGFSVDGLFDVTTSNFGLSTSGDNLFAYQGAAPTSGTASNWIAGFSTRPFLTEGDTTTQTSYLPEALATGNAAFSLGLAASDPQGRRLADLGTVTGTPAQIRAVLADPTNWVTTSSFTDFRSSTVFVVDQTASPFIGTTGSLSAVTTTYGTASGTTTITVTGSNLTGAITATAPAGFEVSSDGTTFGTTATFVQVGGSVNGTLSVRLAAATAIGSYSGTVSLASPGAESVAVAMPTSTVTNPPVKVTGVYVRGSTWNTNYLNLSVFTTVDGSQLGWQLRDGVNQLANSATVPWSNVNRVSVQFDRAISTPQATALTLQVVTAAGAQTVTPTGVTLLAGGTVAQFTVSTLVTGKYVVSIPATGIMDAAGTTVLDGDWTTSVSTFAQGSGDGVAGGIFNFAFNVLVGDAQANGVINGQDRTAVTNQLFRTITSTNFRSNLNGDASINGLDATQVSNQLFRALASLASPTFPTASQATIGSPTFTSVTATGVRLGATVTTIGGEPVLERGVVVLAGEGGTPAVDDPAALKLLSAGGTGMFTVDVTGLMPSTAYRFRAFVRTSLGIVYTEIGSFTTTAV